MRQQFVLSLVSLAVIGFNARLNAQSDPWQGHAYFGAHKTPGAIGDVFSVGAGGEGFVYRGLSAGADLGYMFPLSSAGSGTGLISVNPAYHFVNKERTNRFVPFVIGGCGLAFHAGTASLANFGAGSTFWFRDSLGLRIEVRNYRDSNNSVTARFRFAVASR